MNMLTTLKQHLNSAATEPHFRSDLWVASQLKITGVDQNLPLDKVLLSIDKVIEHLGWPQEFDSNGNAFQVDSKNDLWPFEVDAAYAEEPDCEVNLLWKSLAQRILLNADLATLCSGGPHSNPCQMQLCWARAAIIHIPKPGTDSVETLVLSTPKEIQHYVKALITLYGQMLKTRSSNQWYFMDALKRGYAIFKANHRAPNNYDRFTWVCSHIFNISYQEYLNLKYTYGFDVKMFTDLAYGRIQVADVGDRKATMPTLTQVLEDNAKSLRKMLCIDSKTGCLTWVTQSVQLSVRPLSLYPGFEPTTELHLLGQTACKFAMHQLCGFVNEGV